MSRHRLLTLLDRHLRGALVRFDLPGGPVTVGASDMPEGTGPEGLDLPGGPVTVGAPDMPEGTGPEGHVPRDTPELALTVRDPGMLDRVLAYGNLGLGEAYMDGAFDMTAGDLPDLLGALLRSRLDRRLRGDLRALPRLAAIRAAAALRGGWRNVQRHYDLGDDLFESFLDSTLTYSCAYARADDDDDLEEMQRRKRARICDKLRLRPGERLLDIGCGYGGLLIHAASLHGVTGVGVTVSERHCARAREEVARAGLGERVRIELADHTALPGRFDKVVSVGMMEHLQRAQYDRYVRGIAAALAPSGLGLVHTVGSNAAVNHHDPFIQKYIFPGSAQPRLSEIARGLERHGLQILDVENMLRHYAPTGRAWLRRFRDNRWRLDPLRYPERFQRMWIYYLACVVAAAEHSDSALYQVLFTPDPSAPRPLARV